MRCPDARGVFRRESQGEKEEMEGTIVSGEASEGAFLPSRRSLIQVYMLYPQLVTEVCFVVSVMVCLEVTTQPTCRKSACGMRLCGLVGGIIGLLVVWETELVGALKFGVDRISGGVRGGEAHRNNLK